MQNILSIEVRVIDGEKLFKFEEIYFDLLEADPFEDGQLTVIRGEITILRTDRIGWYGTHGEAICFVSYSSGGLKNKLPATSLAPEYFEESDKLEIVFETEDAFDFISYLLQSAKNKCILDSIIEDVGDNEIGIQEFFDLAMSKSDMKSEIPENKIIRL